MDKIKVNPDQMAAMESMVVAYMVASENKIELSDSEKKSVLLNLDRTWDSMFEVCIKVND